MFYYPIWLQMDTKTGLKIMVAWLPVVKNQDFACSLLALSLGHLYHRGNGEPPRKTLRST
jgi:hypothetical protein